MGIYGMLLKYTSKFILNTKIKHQISRNLYW